MISLFIHAVCQRSSRGLVYNAQHFQARNFARVFSGLPLAVREICRNSYNRLSNRLAQIAFRVLLQFHQYHGRNFLRSIFLALHFGLVIGAHLSFYRYYRIIRIGYSLALCNSAHHALPVLGRHNRRSSSAALGVRNNDRLAAFHNGHAGISSSQIYTYNLSHN